MNDDTLALVGCAAALLISGGFLAISHPLGRLLRSSARQRAEQRTVPFQIASSAESARPAAEPGRRAA